MGASDKEALLESWHRYACATLQGLDTLEVSKSAVANKQTTWPEAAAQLAAETATAMTLQEKKVRKALAGKEVDF